MPEQSPVTIQFDATLIAIVTPDEDVGGFSAEVPALPGCFTQGETIDEVRANLKEAAEGWLATAHDEAVEEERQSGAA